MLYAFCRKAYSRGNLIMKSFKFPWVKKQKYEEQKNRKRKKKKIEQRFKDMPTVTLIHPVELLDRLQVQNSRQSRFKRSGRRHPHSHHSDLEGRVPSNKYLCYTLIISRIRHTRTHTLRAHVHFSVELCIKYIIHGRQGTVE